MPPITFPQANQEQIQRFKEIIQAEHGITLSDAEAAAQCRQFIQYFYLTNYVLPAAREAAAREAERSLSK